MSNEEDFLDEDDYEQLELPLTPNDEEENERVENEILRDMVSASKNLYLNNSELNEHYKSIGKSGALVSAYILNAYELLPDEYDKLTKL